MKLISLNVEGDKHWERIIPFLEKEKPDVLCLQEIFEADVSLLEKSFGMEHVFSPVFLEKRDRENPKLVWEKFGVAIFARFPIQNTQSKNYWSPNLELQKFDNTNIDAQQKTKRQVLLSGDVVIEENTYTVATTHFTWTPNGLADERQRTDADALLKLLAELPAVVLCGDFNMPRDFNDVYKKFTARFVDAVPASYVSSLDLNFHRAGKDPVQGLRVAQYMVDYIFLSPKYRAENVRLQFGVSDHAAVIGNITIRA